MSNNEIALADDRNNYKDENMLGTDQVSTYDKVKPLPRFYSTYRQPPKEHLYYRSDLPSEVFENPDEARSPQEILELYGMRRRDDSMFPNNTRLAMFGDFSEFKDFDSRMNQYKLCVDMFEALPSEIRDNFGNDVMKFSKYINSDDFDITKLMTRKFYENHYKPKLEEERRAELKAKYEREELEKAQFLGKET